MRIKDLIQEKFNKLKQLDRIEFRQKRDYLESQQVNISIGSFFFDMGLVFLLALILFVNLYQITNDMSQFKDMLVGLLFLIKIVIIIGIGLIVLKIYLKLKENKREEELMNQYFKMEKK